MKINDLAVTEALYQKYIAPTQKKRAKFIGVEFEMPIVNLKKEPVEEGLTQAMALAFQKHFGFKLSLQDADGNTYAMQEKESGDILSFDCCYSNLELSLGKKRDIFEIQKTFNKYYAYLEKYLQRHQYTLTGMGINPHYRINHNYPIPSERYRMLLHYLKSYKNYLSEGRKFHRRPDFGTFTSASQVQLDINYDDLLDVINVFGKLEPYKILLFANSPIKDYPKLLCSRNMLWEESMHGYNKRNVGLFEKNLKSIDELLEYFKTLSIYCVERDGKYFDFTPIPIKEYFQKEKVEGKYFKNGRHYSGEIVPRIEDVKYLRAFKLEDLTYRGTIEFRSACCQPIKDNQTLAAFHVGLIEKLPELKELLARDRVLYGHKLDSTALLYLCSCKTLPNFVEAKKLSAQLVKILELAKDGLVKRGLGEEIFLTPLFARAEKLTNPAKEMICGMINGEKLETYIERYAGLS